MASRYNSYDSRSSVTSSIHSDLSSSAEFKSNKPVSSKAIVRSKSSYLTKTTKPVKADNNPGNLTYMMKKLMEMKKSNSKSKRVELVIPEELKKIDTVKGGKSALGTLQRKLFGKEKVKPLTEVKGNTRTLSMVLRSERELLSMNKDQEVEIAELKLQLEEKNREVEKLKDLCLKQREEIKSLKSAVLFPDAMNSQISQIQELNQARQIIPNLQKQVISLNGQLQCIAQDLAEVKANKYLSESCYWQAQTSSYDSLEFSSGSPDGLALEDLNPCLTPYTKKKPKEYERVDSAEESLSGRSTITTTGGKVKSSSKSVKMSRSSEGKAGRRSEESKGWYRGGRIF
ncbi:hypothetical protein ISN45_Aa07g024990 [Arabidopsis thaliana x Arabidopsis arenosa]|uniref:Structural maintenance of chromosomes protein n=1 Tax=Arabidopsis thaliana x Arabidopsis arenosa TaxID=1240361 RepID=A0A8T1YBB4_9BRAS|nr:hypothetical protein ISN45_Aa07g024990 [Arabidopsis thaliana x Arabidopsis arenosa]KAG7542530.1 hypothetical protein ISN45_Aa07g024990 [Arabidopsis thaliana x Arabidopsis arenosa]